ncbi:amidohydrolase family protein, partial [Jatrophihabitans endophyticus]|uniref:amidohydrolase family protein n=1 Tax=Jatrophihabitans endophyticus TaxID=1206085 RepID=UPI001A103DDB
QPCFDELWGGSSGLYSTRLGAERALALNRCGELAAAGVPLAFGSDTPVTALGPWAAVRAAAHHHDPTASLDPLAAFDAHTRAAWVAGGVDDEGVLAPGRPATFAIWRTQVLAPGPTPLPDLRPDADLPECVTTVLRGRTLHDAG